MRESAERAIVIAIESYRHAPRSLSVNEVVRQVALVFPDQDRAELTKRIRRTRLESADAKENSSTYHQEGMREL